MCFKLKTEHRGLVTLLSYWTKKICIFTHKPFVHYSQSCIKCEGRLIHFHTQVFLYLFQCRWKIINVSLRFCVVCMYPFSLRFHLVCNRYKRKDVGWIILFINKQDSMIFQLWLERNSNSLTVTLKSFSIWKLKQNLCYKNFQFVRKEYKKRTRLAWHLKWNEVKFILFIIVEMR